MVRRVLRITSNLTKGGTGNHVLAIQKAINQSREFQSFLWCPREFVHIRNQLDAQLPRAAIFFNAFKTKFLGLDSIYSPFWNKAFRQIHSSFDIIHLHHLQGYFFDIRSLSSVQHKNMVLTVHDYWPVTGRCSIPGACEKWQTHCFKCPNLQTYPATWIDFSRKLYDIKRDAFTKLQHLKVVALSEFMQHQLKKSFLKDKEIHVIPPGIDCDLFRPLPKKQNSDIHLGFVVAKDDFFNKGFDTLLRLIEHIHHTNQKHIRITIVGTLRDRLAARLNAYPFVKLQPFVTDQNELDKLLNSFDLFLNFSRSETFGKTNIEAQSCGVPVLARQIPVFEEAVKYGALFDSDEPETILSHINELTALKWDREKMHQEMREHYHLNRLRERYLKLYRSFD